MSRGFEAGMAGGFAGLTEAELDLLADYTAGLLDGPQATDVAHRIGEDARWARAHAALVGADPAVREDLRAAAAPLEPMPADIVARVDAALAYAARPLAGSVVSLDAGRARRRRVFTGLAAAAAAVVAIAGGIAIAGTFTASQSGTASAPGAESVAQDRAGAGAGTAPTPGPLELDDSARVVASGVDYRPETLGQLARSTQFLSLPPAVAPNEAKASRPEVPPAVRDYSAAPLARLTVPGALAACLEAVRAAHPGEVRLVDFARFNGAPAVIVLIQGASTSTVVAVGPDCGLAGADVKGVATG